MIDWNRARELRDEIGADDLAAVVAAFLEETDAVVAGLTGPGAAADLAATLHFLKGGALNLGFAALAAVCRAGEARASAGGGAGIDLVGIVETYEASRRLFLARLPELIAG